MEKIRVTSDEELDDLLQDMDSDCTDSLHFYGVTPKLGAKSPSCLPYSAAYVL